ncbi:MAG: GDSL-type esterase/lipase family protein [Clostridiales bacterium]|nr:GDSL-type esterase/lipase family protein [Clostridiales bacterium]
MKVNAGTMICYGDSNTWGYDPCTPFGSRYPEESLWCTILGRKMGLAVRNESLNGRSIPRRDREIERLLERISRADAFLPPAWFLVMLGSNDLLQGRLTTAEDVAARMEYFLMKLKMHPLVISGALRLCLISPACMRPGEWVREERLLAESRRLGEAYDAVAQRLDIDFIDAGKWEIPVTYDGVHFTQEGHAVFAQNCAAAMTAMTGPGRS